MPSTVTFVKINRSFSLPIRIHVNRKKLISSKLFYSAIDLSARSKALLTLKKINYIRISNKDISSLTKSVGDDVLDLLLHTPISELIRKLIPNEIPLAPNTVCLDLNKGAWKCHLVAPIHYILNLRQRLGIAWNEEEQVLYAKVKTSIKASRMRMLTKSATMNEPTILVEEEEEENLIPEVVEPVDTKKATLSYQFKKQTILNDLGGTLDIYIYERPHK